ncbi:hypothetical protein [Streptomyces sp. YIM 121038]|uniref:hypothetical protein n=1 Tax=Streptomyces sp. YIM 121038 TaxID=2136401 RepID=UPI0011103259|nr:hypothetical protein [Streptomyces sp. YIM 121038]
MDEDLSVIAFPRLVLLEVQEVPSMVMHIGEILSDLGDASAGISNLVRGGYDSIATPDRLFLLILAQNGLTRHPIQTRLHDLRSGLLSGRSSHLIGLVACLRKFVVAILIDPD